MGCLLNLIFQVDFTTREDDNNNKDGYLILNSDQKAYRCIPLTQSQDSHALGLFCRQGLSACREPLTRRQ